MTEHLNNTYKNLLTEELTPGLYIVATNIGNHADITIRALTVLERVNFVICEDRKNGSKLLKSYGISKPLEILNEHNERTEAKILVEKLYSDKCSAALISDTGTPLFADPGSRLLKECYFFNIPVIPVPGASSLMAALMISGIAQGKGQFFYYGFLPANKEERIKALYRLKGQNRTDYVFLEAPYRLEPLLRDFKMILGEHRNGIIAYKMTTDQEKIFTGTIDELIYMTSELPKGEFVFILLAVPGPRK